MDIATLRRAHEALVDLEQVEWLIAREKEKITAAQADVSDMQEWVQKLESRIAGCKQTLMECGIAVPVTRVSRHEALRTLESEGQKWDEEARARNALKAKYGLCASDALLTDDDAALRRAADQFNHALYAQRMAIELGGVTGPEEHHGC